MQLSITLEKGREVFSTWILTADEKKKLKTSDNNFEAYVKPEANPIFALYIFYEKVQGENEGLGQFVTTMSSSRFDIRACR